MQEIVELDVKTPESVIGSSKSTVTEKAQALRSVAPAFDQGPRSVPPVLYKEQKKTVPTETKQFVVDEMKQEAPMKPAQVVEEMKQEAPKPAEPEKVVVEEPKKTAPTLPMSLNKLRSNHQKLVVAPPQPVKAEDQRVLLSDLTVRPLPKGSFKALGLTGDPSTKILFVVEFLPEITEYMQKIENEIAEFISKQKVSSYKPSKNEVVLALYEGRFYRAVCRASTKIGDVRHYSVQFLDYGDVAQVTEESIRPFDKSLMFEIVTHSCKILNMPTDEEALAKIVGSEFFQLKDAKESDEEGASYTANFDI